MSSTKQAILPKFIGEKIWRVKNAYKLNKLKKSILHYYTFLPKNLVNEEQSIALDFIKKNGISVFPYPFAEKYSPKDIKVLLDKELGLRYVILDKKRLYFKRSLSEKEIKQNYYFLEMEQDKESPHRYLTDEFQVVDGDTIVDIGAAEGNFSLSVVEKAKAIYLFETDEEWIEALEATFAPWKDKVQIINRFVSDVNDDKNITLDNFFADKDAFDFIKIDVDGAERPLLKGFDELLSSNMPLKIALCTYHQQHDEQEFSDLLIQKGFNITTSKNYMLFIYGEPLQPPYFRRGLIRATR
ncbi:MAG: FkbM family methyltransferase [Saprospiraceae bacterium]|nr:FkbM family methyltransferase [Saprospiraceae bacterium]